jgi:phosphoribosylformimino-5-aminoimidazole carboxamide ribotide isomerase
MIRPCSRPPPRPAFTIVPVLDLLGGLVVRAKAGERQAYAPIKTPLSASPDPVAVTDGLLAALPARCVYIADLDAILGTGDNQEAIRRIAREHPSLSLWVDAGIATEAAARRFLDTGLGRIVLGSESQTGPDVLRALTGQAVLSLDYRGDDPLGPAALHVDASLWPGEVIVMTLARVGTASGPDCERIETVRGRKPEAAVYAAGGVRGPQDLARLKELGTAGVLVASAIHDGTLRREHLDAPA